MTKSSFLLESAITLALLLAATGCSNLSNQMDIGMVASAGGDLIKAANLDDKEVKQLAFDVAKQSDKTAKVLGPSTKQGARLNRIAAPLAKSAGGKFNFKVYQDPEINAFALADGSIRVYSGLMDKMTDDELAFVVGHEIGHVVNGDSKAALRTAYVTSAAKKGVSAQYSRVGDIAYHLAGDILEKLINAQYSQSQERSADDNGLKLLKNTKKNPQAAVTALRKLSTDASNSSMFSSHPDPEERAERLEEALTA